MVIFFFLTSLFVEREQIRAESIRQLTEVHGPFNHKTPPNKTGSIVSQTDMYGKLLVVEGKGFTMKSDVYKSLPRNVPYLNSQEDLLLKESQFNEIFNNIENGVFKVYCFKYGVHDLDPNGSKLLEFSDEIHMNITTTYTDNAGNKIVVCFGHFTSNKDDGTIFISSKQYINKDSLYKNKEQRFRPYTQLVIVPMDKVKDYSEATLFCSETNLEGHNIQQRLIAAIKNNEGVLRENTVRKYHNFTRENLQQIAENFLERKLQNSQEFLSTLENKLKNLPEDKRKQKEQIMRNQLKNAENKQMTNEVLKELSPEYKEIRKYLENKIKYENQK